MDSCDAMRRVTCKEIARSGMTKNKRVPVRSFLSLTKSINVMYNTIIIVLSLSTGGFITVRKVIDLRKRLGKLELQVMKLIWDKGRATVRDIWEELYTEKRLAYTTVATVMRKLESKGFLKHDERERTYIYTPLIDQDKVSQGLLREMIDGLFDGSAAKLVTTLIQSEHFTEKDLSEIQRIILEHRGKGSDG